MPSKLSIHISGYPEGIYDIVHRMQPRVLVDWAGRHADEEPTYFATDAHGEGNAPIFINLHPELKDGLIFATTDGLPGDTVHGMGLPNNHHASFRLTYQYR
jgi:hypothetical protein